MRVRNLFIALIIGIAAFTIFFSILLGEFLIFPLFCMIPLICGLRRGLEEQQQRGNEQEREYPRSRPAGTRVEIIDVESDLSEAFCSNCNNEIKEINLRFCPYCGSKL